MYLLGLGLFWLDLGLQAHFSKRRKMCFCSAAAAAGNARKSHATASGVRAASSLGFHKLAPGSRAGAAVATAAPHAH